MEIKNIIEKYNLEIFYDYVVSFIGDLKEKWYFYHNLDHTIDVTKRSLYLAEKENLKENETKLLLISALFHDTGFIEQYKDNEPIWAKIARFFLEKNNFSENEIILIEENILATSMNYFHPKNIFEQIIKDADLDNLWRTDENEISQNLKKEIETVTWVKISEEKWLENSLNILSSYEFFTETQKKERDKQKEINLENYKTKN